MPNQNQINKELREEIAKLRERLAELEQQQLTLPPIMPQIPFQPLHPYEPFNPQLQPVIY
jgi:cell division septum initiation protein DivIVA